MITIKHTSYGAYVRQYDTNSNPVGIHAARYVAGEIPPNYPVPSTLVRTDVPGNFLGNGIFEYYPDGSIKWGIYDAPLPDGSRVID